MPRFEPNERATSQQSCPTLSRGLESPCRRGAFIGSAASRLVVERSSPNSTLIHFTWLHGPRDVGRVLTDASRRCHDLVAWQPTPSVAKRALQLSDGPFLHPSLVEVTSSSGTATTAPKSPDRLGVDEAQTATRTNDAELPFANSRLRSAPPLSTSCWAARAAVVASCMLATENSVSSDVCCAERGLVGWRLRQSRQGRGWWWRCRWSSPSVDTTR